MVQWARGVCGRSPRWWTAGSPAHSQLWAPGGLGAPPKHSLTCAQLSASLLLSLSGPVCPTPLTLPSLPGRLSHPPHLSLISLPAPCLSPCLPPPGSWFPFLLALRPLSPPVCRRPRLSLCHTWSHWLCISLSFSFPVLSLSLFLPLPLPALFLSFSLLLPSLCSSVPFLHLFLQPFPQAR